MRRWKKFLLQAFFVAIGIIGIVMIARGSLGGSRSWPRDRRNRSVRSFLPPQSSAAWEAAGCSLGWMSYWKSELSRPRNDETQLGVDLPTFDIRSLPIKKLKSLPTPEVPFGIYSPSAKDADLKELVGLPHLEGLNFRPYRGDEYNYRIADVGLKDVSELTELKILRLRCVWGVTDAGLKDLAKLKQLQVLDLADTDVTDAGLTDLAKLNAPSRILDLTGTRVTWLRIVPAGIARDSCGC